MEGAEGQLRTGSKMSIRNVTEARPDEDIPGGIFEFLMTDHSVPFVILFCLFLVALLPCCLINCKGNKKRSRLSIVADSENTEELACLRMEEGEARKGSQQPPPPASPPQPAPLTRRNLSVFSRTSDQFTRLESIDEERSRESSAKSFCTVEELTETVEGLRNSITEEWGGQLNEKLSKQIRSLMDKIKSLKMRSQSGWEESDSGMGLLTPRSRRLSSQISMESARKNAEVESILENIRNNAEDLKDKIEKRLQGQEVDESVVTLVKQEVNKVVGQMLEIIPPTPMSSRCPPSPWSVKTQETVLGSIPQSPWDFGGKLPRFIEQNGGERSEPWCPRPKTSREPSPEEELEIGDKDTLPSSWRPTPIKKLKKIKEESKTGTPLIGWRPEVTVTEQQPSTNLLNNTVEGSPLIGWKAEVTVREQQPSTKCLSNTVEDKPFMVFTPEPKDIELKFPETVKNKKEDLKEISEMRDVVKADQLKKEVHGLWELEMAMIDIREDIDRSMKIHSPKFEKEGNSLKQLDVRGITQEVYSKSCSTNGPQEDTPLDFNNY